MKKPSLFSILGRYKALIGFLVLFALAGSALNLILPKIIAHAIDSYNAGSFRAGAIIAEFSAATIFIFVFSYLQNVMQVYASERVARDIRRRISAAVSNQSFSWVESVGASKLLTNITSDTDAVKSFVAQAFPSLVSAMFVIIGSSILLVSLNWKLGLSILIMIPLVALTFGLIFSRIGGLFKKAQEIIDRLNKIISDSILGAAIIRVLNSQSAEYDRFLVANTESLNTGQSILRLFASMIPIIVFISNLGIITVLIFGGHLVMTGSMTIGDFTAFQSYVAVLVFPMMMIGFVSNVIASAGASYGRIAGILDLPEPSSSGIVSKSLTGQITVQNVSRTAGGSAILKDVSFEIASKTKTAIVGPTGGGKTQLLYMMAGLLAPDAGSVRYDGTDINDFDRAAFFKQVGIVFQDSVMFNLSIRENILFGSSASDESLSRAIEAAELSDFVSTLPKGLDTLVSERGTSLSGGQKQRIMLARALALDPKILLLDDFTARVDAETERKILANLVRLYPNLTLISVTQKIAPIEHYDKIILVMEGELLASGTHDKLLSQSVEYAQIASSQKSTNTYEELSS